MTDILRTDGKRIRSMSDKGRAWLCALEGGSRLKAYRDSNGLPTIGPGLTLILAHGGPRLVTMADRFDSQLAAMAQFEKQLVRYEVLVDAATRDDIDQATFDAFTSLAYNCEAAMMGSTLTKRFNAGAPVAVIVSELKRWNRAGGQIREGLVERRECEADLLLYGIYRLQGQRAKHA